MEYAIGATINPTLKQTRVHELVGSLTGAGRSRNVAANSLPRADVAILSNFSMRRRTVSAPGDIERQTMAWPRSCQLGMSNSYLIYLAIVAQHAAAHDRSKSLCSTIINR